MGEFQLRAYRAEDHDQVLALHRTGLAHVGIRPGDGIYYEHDLTDPDTFRSLYLGARSRFLVGEHHGRLIAIGGLKQIDDRTAEIVRMRVQPDFQGRGFGRRLLVALEEEAHSLGYHVIQLDSSSLQQRAVHLYRSHGYQETHRRQVGDAEVIYFRKYLPRQSR